MVCLVWTAILLLQLKGADRAHKALAAFGVVATLLYFCHYLHFNGLQTHFSESLYYLCNLSVYPLFALYVKCLIGKDLPRASFFLWFLPALAVFVWSLIGGMPEQVTQYVFPLVSVASCVVAAGDLLRFRAGVNNYYSNPAQKRLDPLFVMLVLLLVTAMFSFTVNLFGREHFMGSERLMIPAIGFSALLFALFFIGDKTEFPQEDVRLEGAPGVQTDTTSQQALMDKIRSQMQDQQLFRSKGLTITELAEAVGSNRTYVSSCINHLGQQSFSDYINSWRIRYARLLMEEKPPLPLSEVADRAGFTDRISFYRSFKKLTGMSPSEWMETKQ